MNHQSGLGRGLGLCFLVGLQIACASHTQSAPEPEHPWSAAPLEEVICVRDGRTGEELSFSELLDDLAEAEVVFLGEQHTDETTHRVELAVYEGLLERQDGAVVLALEMFERDVQSLLNQYVAGEIDEPTFLEGARPWSNYGAAYRPMIERARRDGGPVVAANFPRALRMRMAMAEDGAEFLANLEGEEQAWAPAELLANTPEYWRLVDNAVRGHIGMMGGPKDPSDPRLLATQSLWDNSMGDACALALDNNPGFSVLHVNGGFHSSYWDGTTRQLMLRKPDIKVLTVDIVPVSTPTMNRPSGKPVADYVVYAARRATDISSGQFAVTANRELKYRVHLPQTATDDDRAPLLIWLGESGLTARDGIALWKERLGEEVAIVALEMPYREIAGDLGDGGRWFWPDTFPEDIGTIARGVEGAWGYVSRNMPVDGSRVVLAGEGLGATVVSAIALLSDMPVESRAFAPRQFQKIKDFPLPLPELRGSMEPVDKRLVVYANDDDEAWWKEELDGYTEIGFENELGAAVTDPFESELAQENSIRTALGLEQASPQATAGRRVIQMTSDSVRAQLWARLAAHKESVERNVQVAVVEASVQVDDAESIDMLIRAASYREAKRLPTCPGNFGGTTVVILPNGTADEEAQAWLALEDDDPLTKRSRFLRMRVAFGTGERTLTAVLEKLASESRTNILIVPAEFCATNDRMRSLSRRVKHLEDSLTLHWLPGLGGQ
ncbi:MAG: putative iron-regulated protein [Planctomycetota bacterium]|jgi:uncharacterized iron-regulated protein